jgi:hypothetical protein
LIFFFFAQLSIFHLFHAQIRQLLTPRHCEFTQCIHLPRTLLAFALGLSELLSVNVGLLIHLCWSQGSKLLFLPDCFTAFLSPWWGDGYNDAARFYLFYFSSRERTI